MTKPTSPFVTLSLSQAKVVLLAKAVEQTDGKSGAWTSTDSQSVSLKTAHALGESASSERFLFERAKRVLELADERHETTHVNTKANPTLALAWLLILTAFAGGVALDQLGNVEHVINLLAPPFWSVLLWNLVVYVVLIGCALGCIGYGKNRFSLPLRNLLQWCAQHSSHLPLQRGLRGSFYTDWSRLTAPLVRLHVARCLHAAAIAFSLGLICSLLFRGFGTAYWVGWESTWLSEQPETVKAILDWTYGLVPTFEALPAMPDLELVKNLRTDQLPYLKEPVSAAPWLIRMMVMLAVVVIVPRLLFILFDTWRIRRWQKRVSLPIADPYFQNLLQDQELQGSLGALRIVAPKTASEAAFDRLETLLDFWGDETGNDIEAMDYYADCILAPEWPVGERPSTILVYFDATATPESDVHGNLTEALRTMLAAQGHERFAVLLDKGPFAERNKNYPDRWLERLRAWQALCDETGVALFVLGETQDEQIDFIKRVRNWSLSGSPIVADAAEDKQ